MSESMRWDCCLDFGTRRVQVQSVRRENNMKFLLSSLFLLVVIVSSIQASQYENKLPVDAADALQVPGKVILYSLEPWSMVTTNDNAFHGYKILGQATLDGKQAAIAVAAFESAISDKEHQFHAACFDPRHAIRLKSNGHTYDFLLCYACGYLYAYRDDKNIAMLDAAGSPKVLNGLLMANNVPISKSGE